MKELDEIRRLLDAYYEGRSSVDEERRLCEFFRQEQVPAEFAADRELFLRLSSMQEEAEVPAGLEERMAACIDRWAQEEQAVCPSVGKTPIYRLLLRKSVGIAAGLLLMISVGTYVYHTSVLRPLPEDTYASPEEAYAEVQKALLLFSHSLNKGLAQVEKAESATGKVRKVVEKHVNNLNN